MVDKIKTDSEEFQRAVARGDRAQIEQWDREGLILWNPRNQVAKVLSERAQAERKQQEEDEAAGGEKPNPEGLRAGVLDKLGVGKDERLWSGHPLVQRAIRSGDSALLATIYADDRYDSLQGTGPAGGFTRSDIESYYRDAS